MFTDRTSHWLNVIFPHKVLLPGDKGVIVPSGTTAQRPSPPDPGTIRYNTTTIALEVYIGAPTNAWEEIAGGTGGLVKTASNVGTGAGVFKQKVGFDLEFKSLLGSGGITITDLGEEILISAAGAGSGESNTASNIGGAIGIFDTKVGVDLRFKSLNSLSTDLSIVDSGTTIDLNLVGAPYLSLTGGTITGDVSFAIGAHISAAPLGTAADPSYNFSGNSDTGMYSPAADELAFSTGGTEKLHIDSFGELSVPTGYESLVTSDNVLTNKKYVDDAITNSSPVKIYKRAFTEADLTAGVLAVTHGFGLSPPDQSVNVSIYDNNMILIIPDGIKIFDGNQINITLGTFQNLAGTLPGSWHLVVIG